MVFKPPPRTSAFGAILKAVTAPERAEHFQPTNINFGLLQALEKPPRDKKLRKQQQIERARVDFVRWKNALEIGEKAT